MDAPALLALDFDGVVCDGRREYFEAAWRAYRRVWPDPLAADRPDALAAEFFRQRPLVESGWEMPVLLHALLARVEPAGLLDRAAWRATARRLVADAGVTAEALGRALNAVRDEWFAADSAGWLAHHDFYPGVIERLPSLLEQTRVVVVTTKAERFARALLAGRDDRLAAVPVIGREPGRPVPKPEILARLAAQQRLVRGEGVWLVEDLLEALEGAAAYPGLEGARLFLAAWGYNTLEDRARASAHPRIRLLSLGRFAGPLDAWPR
ncbi:MAG TPA: HAD family hydrolase [Candidatus Tectomicrobia bacterium]|nr:HAD family hydrolase [Candidatus Tectomicrobia bacterium]